MRTPDQNFIASETLVWIKADGSETDVVARVGVPVDDRADTISTEPT